MNKKAFVVAGIFLVVALIVPPIVIHVHSDADLINILNQGATDATQVQEAIQTINQANLIVFVTIGVVDLVCVILFVVFIWIALKPGKENS